MGTSCEHVALAKSVPFRRLLSNKQYSFHGSPAHGLTAQYQHGQARGIAQVGQLLKAFQLRTFLMRSGCLALCMQVSNQGFSMPF